MDWSKLIDDLRGVGMSQAEMAATCECSDSTISELKSGLIANPAYPVGKCLVDLHAKKVDARKTARKAA